MMTYQEQVNAGANPDWRIKEALMTAIGHLKERIEDQGDNVVATVEPML
jgi:hypothetical protein